jgi:hypothetical protein
MRAIQSKSYENGSESESFPVIDVDVHAHFIEPELFDLNVSMTKFLKEIEPF